MLTEADVNLALSGVLDPELDRSLVELGFVDGIHVEGGRVEVRLRLPTYWCAPNFSWLMASDARRALLALSEVEDVRIELVDHHAADEIGEGVNAGRTFEEVFDEQGVEGLEALRRLFRCKAFLIRQERLAEALPQEDLPALRLGDLAETPEARAYLEIRRELALDCSPEAPFLTDAAGRPVPDVEAHLRRARTVRLSVEGNGALCRGLLETRYPHLPREVRT